MFDEAKKKGYLTFQQVDRYLPDEGGDPSMVDQIVLSLEETGLDLREDPNAKDPSENGHNENGSSNGSNGNGSVLARSILGSQESAALSSRDPIRMYLSQMGNIPLLTRDRE